MLSIVLTICSPVALFVIYTAWSLFSNYLIARKVGLPLFVIPVSPENPLWLLLCHYIIPLLSYVPFGNGNFTRFGETGWEFREKARVHIEYGDAIIIATPGKNWIYMCDADVIRDIIRRERQGDFARPVELLAMLDVFGPNISTMNGADWQRQRKCTAASFNEQSNVLVWTESLRQGQQLLQYWKNNTSVPGVSTMAKDTRTLALNVLVHAAFGKSFDFQGTHDKKITSGPLSYRDALALILENAIAILALGPQTLERLAFIPPLGRLSEAAKQFRKYMLDMFEEYTHSNDSMPENKLQGNLMTSLIRASLTDKLITPDEAIGNMFVFNFAGHDTTSHSLAFTFMLLAAHPEVQDWMAEEIRYVLGEKQISELNYSEFPRFVRTLSVLLETVRLYNPLLSIVKGTETQPSLLTVRGKVVTIPPHTRVLLNLNALQTHPRYWGSDGESFNPSRWIHSTPSGTSNIHDREYLQMNEHGAYIPWGEGNRSCPGKKFAQVEHVAVMVSMFRDHVIGVKRWEGESAENARERARGALRDSGMKLLLQMLRPEKTPLVWERRV
ncbi:unnamed protein product [Periconia digitata]|uniref:Cytochrome P450 n=1 Tax=Periconia digitata TaxID=1303443 RepID=A0A9W4ULB1_9PLEO|nr:unnamed protein product [Periconia digitata]